MGYSLNAVQAEAVLQALKQNYSVYAPKRFPKQGRYSDTDVIKYAEVEHYEDIVWQVKSDYPAKEVLTPIQQAIFYFTEDEYRASKGPKKPILILARPCDINAQHVQAKIYAGNGGYTDLYYERMREKVKFALMECNGGDDTCFCVSMGTNKTDDYSLALKFSDEGVQVQVTDEAFAPYFEGMPQAGYTPAFVEENELKVTVPDLDDKAVRLAPRAIPCGRSLTAAASPAAPVPWPAPPAPASPPATSSTATTPRWASAAASPPPARSPASTRWPASGSSAPLPASGCATRCSTSSTTTRPASARATCAWAAAGAPTAARSSSPFPPPLTRSTPP